MGQDSNKNAVISAIYLTRPAGGGPSSGYIFK
jgi:hypothetical protein